MKFALSILFFIVQIYLALSAEEGEMKTIMDGCMAETKVSQVDVNHITENGDSTPSLQCYVKCVMTKMGHIKNGAFDSDVALKHWKELPDTNPHKPKDPSVFTKCKNEKGSNDCETAYKIFKCIYPGKA